MPWNNQGGSNAEVNSPRLQRMSRHDELRRLSRKSRNQLRGILSDGGDSAIARISELRGKLGRQQILALDSILSSASPLRRAHHSPAFPKSPVFTDRLGGPQHASLQDILYEMDRDCLTYEKRLVRLVDALSTLDACIGRHDLVASIQLLEEIVESGGWSHILLRKLVFVREALPEASEVVEQLIAGAGLASNALVVASLVHLFAEEQAYLTIKRSITNVVDRGSVNCFSRTLAKFPVQPFVSSEEDLRALLTEVRKCSLVDAIVAAKLNRHLINERATPHLSTIISRLGVDPDNSRISAIVSRYDRSEVDAEYIFYKQSSAWLEYEPVLDYRVLLDTHYDGTNDPARPLHKDLLVRLDRWVGTPSLANLARGSRLTRHEYAELSLLEASGRISRSAIFNYWLQQTEGQIGFEREDLLVLMGLTQDLARTIPIVPTRNAARLSQDPLVRLILLLLLARRSKNELDSFHLRKLLEEKTVREYEGSLVKLVEAYETSHPYVAEYIYETATEDFLAKLNKLAPHLSDIPNIRASLHEWMARKTGDERFLERARAVRIDHQLNRIRNEIDDHRIYVDPSRFSSWIQDEMMIELNSALAASGSGKKGVTVTSDEAVLSLVMRQCYSAFCSNAMFGIASYIGRRIRHGTFHGHLYSSVINHTEKSVSYRMLHLNETFQIAWDGWKREYDKLISEIVRDKLHVYSRQKPLGLLQPETYTPHKQEIVDAAVKALVARYSEIKSTVDLDAIITDYCWRLAEVDLATVTTHLKGQRSHLIDFAMLEISVDGVAANSENRRALTEFKHELIHTIDSRLTTICGWFKRPSNVAPKASVALLYDAVVHEVRDSIPGFDPQTEASPHGDVELVGGTYHVMYDSLAVVVSNAAKYGDPRAPVRRAISVVTDQATKAKRLVVEIRSRIRSTDDPSEVAKTIEQRKAADSDDANLYQGQSGIPKLMQLARSRADFEVDFIGVDDMHVIVVLSYALEH